LKSSKPLITIAICAGSLSTSLYADPVTPLPGYVQTTLVTNTTDPDLVNPWGISSSSTSPFWVSDNGSGKATLYNSAGVKQGLEVTMPAGGTAITGQVFNGSSFFNGDSFLFASENGTIDGWRPGLGTSAEILFGVAAADYTGLAISDDKKTIFAANFSAGTIDEFTSAGLMFSYSDPNMPAGFAPFNIQNIDGVFYVTFANLGSASGFVDTLDPTTRAFTRLISQGALDSPWGLALAPASFGGAAGDLLVGNFGNGTINAYDPVTGAPIGALADPSSALLVNNGLWGLIFGNGGNGGTVDSLYITAGGSDESSGLLARIDAPATVPEPALTWLMGAGVIALTVVRRRIG
jgi:uncharacterized protein (TIGR03118 family)